MPNIKPPLAFRVGIVGHRPKRLPIKTDDLQVRLHDLLLEIKQAVEVHYNKNKELYAQGTPILRALSPLSEGSDRLFAGAATQAGFELFGVFPFPENEYSKDFPSTVDPVTNVSPLKDFQHRIQALPRFEMDGLRTTEAAEDLSYRNAGLVVNRQSDILIAVWDGDRQGKVGGTEDSMEAALRDGVPVIWVDAYEEHTWTILKNVTDIPRQEERESGTTEDHEAPPGRSSPLVPGSKEDIAPLVEGRLAMPLPSLKDRGATLRKKVDRFQRTPSDEYIRFLHQRQFDRNSTLVSPFAWFWNLLKKTVGKEKRPGLRKEAYHVSLAREWPDTNQPVLDDWCTKLKEPFAHADQLSVHYSERYRGTFILLFLAGAMAVCLAVLPMALGMDHRPATFSGTTTAHETMLDPWEIAIVASELIALIFILVLWPIARWKRWQERWLDHRVLAELIRQMRYVAPIGGRRVLPRMGGHLSGYGDPANTWMAWYVRAWERVVGLPVVVLDPQYLKLCGEQAAMLASSQRSYHQGIETTYERIDHRLHWTSMILGLATFLACGLHLLALLAPSVENSGLVPTGRWLVFFCAFFPALAAALAGMNNQGEFKRASMLSKAMVERLKEHETAIDALTLSPPSDLQYSPLIAAQASSLTELMSQEAMGWRVIFTDRPVVPPT